MEDFDNEVITETVDEGRKVFLENLNVLRGMVERGETKHVLISGETVDGKAITGAFVPTGSTFLNIVKAAQFAIERIEKAFMTVQAGQGEKDGKAN